MEKRGNLLLQNQAGAALVIALVILVVLTLISLSSSITSISEIKLSGNKRGSTDAFFTADGGIQATIANVNNFKSSTYTPIPSPTGISADILSQDVDTYLPNNKTSSNPRVTFPTPPTGGLFTSEPTVLIYHMTTTAIPRGLPFGTNTNFEYFIIDSTATDSLGSTSEVVTTAIRIMPQ